MFEEAIDQPVDDREDFVRSRCGDNEQLQTEVLSLLASFDPGEEELEQSPVGKSEPRGVSVGEVPADEIPGYELHEELHRGGQGVVYKATQLSTRREVALKFMLEGRFASESTRRRFEREVELAGRLKHPGIVPVFDSGLTSGHYYYAMQFVDGERLDEYAVSHSLSPDATLELFKKVCNAVNYAHQRGVIHRDLKPSNILVNDAGQPHVLDFGLAKPEEEGKDSTTISMTGQIMGTLAYMSPEQAAGQPDEIDVRSDVYSLGVVLYELLTGELPYELDFSLAENLSAIINSAPTRPEKLNRAITNEAGTIVLKAMSKEKSRRYQTAGALEEDIDRYLTGQPIAAKRDSALYVMRKTLSRYKVFAGMALVSFFVVAAAAVTGWLYYLDAEDARRREWKTHGKLEEQVEFANELKDQSQLQLYFAEMNLAGQAYTGAGGIQRMEEIVRRWDAEQYSEVEKIQPGWEWHYLNALCNQESADFVCLDQPECISLHPDGRQLAVGFQNGAVRVIDYGTGDWTNLIDPVQTTAPVQSVDWSPDGALLAVASGDSVDVRNFESKQQVHQFQTEWQVSALAFHPQQPVLAVTGSAGDIIFWHATDGFLFEINEEIAASSLVWSRDGKFVVTGTQDEKVSFWDFENRRQNFKTRSIPSTSTIDVSPDLGLIAAGNVDGLIEVRRTQGEQIVWTVDSARAVSQLAFSPDGAFLAAVGNDRTLRIWHAATGEPMRTFEGHAAAVMDFDWNPDGETISTCSYDKTIKRWNMNTTAAVRTIYSCPDEETEVFTIDWNRQAEQILVAGSASSISLIKADGSSTGSLTVPAGGVLNARWSLDGKSVATVQTDACVIFDLESIDERFRIERAFEGNEKEDHGDAIAWSPHSDQFLFVTPSGEAGVFSSADGSQRTTFQLLESPSTADWSPADEVAIGFSSGEIFGTDVTGKSRTSYHNHSGSVNCIRFSPDGTLLASAGEDGTILIQETAGQQIRHQMIDHLGAVTFVTWHPTGRRLASCSDDRTVRIWDVESGTQLLSLPVDDLLPRAVAWSPDGKMLVAAGRSGKVHMWDANSGF
ncbi:MAG: serine/threonine-protein kinase [Planctomycetota bacterium]